ncbi:threonine aspartase 1 [Sitophilus oryzae]|uniref:Threonine aspartase 1 n=1 Tax=Sitophilus oryzae TaxID=7048 RepID=A0A6J2YPM2_SITOR|nr:threonine aspartase 1 [Sitophilus oryzae]XP_030765988.1 threonine aspartase 1 [Sitophilus oryzae]
MIAVHCGAGQYNSGTIKEYKVLSKRACKKSIAILDKGGTAIHAVREALTVLENDPSTNAGFGSNLTLEGYVECDASIMNGENLKFGACGAVRKVKNPIVLAHDIYEKQSTTLPLGLIPPQLLVGSGAYQHAKKSGIKIVKDDKLISPKALKYYKKYKRLLEHTTLKKDCADPVEFTIDYSNRNDTVGAVCIDERGHVAAGCSSGGLLLKRPGRVGQAAHYGSGVWADSCNGQDRSSVAVCTTGCGEQIMQTFLAKALADDLIKNTDCPTVSLYKSMTENFMNSRYLQQTEAPKLGGALVLKADSCSGDISLLWTHTTPYLGIGYMKKGEKAARSVISTLPRNAKEGHSVNVGGTEFCYKKPNSFSV